MLDKDSILLISPKKGDKNETYSYSELNLNFDSKDLSPTSGKIELTKCPKIDFLGFTHILVYPEIVSFITLSRHFVVFFSSSFVPVTLLVDVQSCQ